MATRRIFSEFCINRFGIGPLYYISSRSDFGFEFAEIFIIKKRLSDSPSGGVSDSPSQGVADSPTLRLAEFSFKHSKADSPTRRVRESVTPRLAESGSRRLPESESRQLAESGSHFLITNISANSKPKSERLER